MCLRACLNLTLGHLWPLLYWHVETRCWTIKFFSLKCGQQLLSAALAHICSNVCKVFLCLFFWIPLLFGRRNQKNMWDSNGIELDPTIGNNFLSWTQWRHQQLWGSMRVNTYLISIIQFQHKNEYNFNITKMLRFQMKIDNSCKIIKSNKK